MRRRGLKIFAGIAAGLIAVTGLAGAVTKVQVQGNETVETTEYKVESNESSVTNSEYWAGSTQQDTELSELWEVPENIESVDGWATLYSAGFDGEILIAKEAGSGDNGGGGQYWFFTRKNGEKKVRCAGFLWPNLDLRCKDGIIYACNAEDKDYLIEESYETYVVSPDGKRILHKDYVNADLWGFTSNSNSERNKVTFEGDYNDYNALWENYYNADVVEIGPYTRK